jgi:hypothetical protein
MGFQKKDKRCRSEKVKVFRTVGSLANLHLRYSYIRISVEPFATRVNQASLSLKTYIKLYKISIKKLKIGHCPSFRYPSQPPSECLGYVFFKFKIPSKKSNIIFVYKMTDKIKHSPFDARQATLAWPNVPHPTWTSRAQARLNH